MKVGKVIRGVLVAYLAVGVAVVLGQAIATSVMEPECPGLARHTLLEGSRVRQIVTWLPDFYRETIRGEMTLKNYLLGGLQCEGQRLTLAEVESLRAFIQGVPRTTESISESMAKAAGASPNAGQPGSKAEALLNETAPKTIEVDGVSFELAGDWRERDIQKILANREVKDVTPLVVREYGSPDQPSSALVRIAILSDGPGILDSPEGFAKGILSNLEEIGMRNVVVTMTSSISVGAFPGIYAVLQGDGPDGLRWEYSITGVMQPSRQVQLGSFLRLQPASAYREAVDRARTSLKVGN
jgi:hypothetical protein